MIDSSAAPRSAIGLPARPAAPAFPIPRVPVPRTGIGALAGKVDRYLRRGDTLLASAVLLLDRGSGESYSRSRAKRTLDIVIAVPGLLFALVPLLLIVAVNRLLYPSQSALFLQYRVGRNRTIRVIKVRSMCRSEAFGTSGQSALVVTRFGSLIRRFYLDELPQLLQVLTGQLSIVGIRVLP